jgi:hypothetical protein
MCFLRQTAGVTLLSALAALLAAAASPAAERTAPSILDGIGCPAHVGPTVAARHLFAGQVNGATQKGVVKRFPLLNGKPVHTPDLCYPGFTGPIAVDAADGVYITKSFSYSQAQEIDFFTSGSTLPSRRLFVTYPTSLVQTTALAVDRAGYLYVAIDAQTSSSGTDQVNVYRPGAHGNAKPVAIVSPIFQTFITALAFNAGGELFAALGSYASNHAGGILVYSDPRSSPKVVRTLTGPYIDGITGIAIGEGELYVLSSALAVGGAHGLIAAFPDSANGSPAPDRTITVQNEVALSGGVTLNRGRLFVPEDGRLSNPKVPSEVYEIDATRGGSQLPIDTLVFPLYKYVLDLKAD